MEEIMKATINGVGVTLTIDLTDQEDAEFMSMSKRPFRPVSMVITYGSAYGRGFYWDLTARQVKKDGTLGAVELKDARYSIQDKDLVERLDKLAESLNPMAALESLKGQDVPGTV